MEFGLLALKLLVHLHNRVDDVEVVRSVAVWYTIASETVTTWLARYSTTLVAYRLRFGSISRI